jgi:hypothetical protein
MAKVRFFQDIKYDQQAAASIVISGLDHIKKKVLQMLNFTQQKKQHPSCFFNAAILFIIFPLDSEI